MVQLCFNEIQKFSLRDIRRVEGVEGAETETIRDPIC